MRGDASHENSEEEIVLDDVDRAVEIVPGVRGELQAWCGEGSPQLLLACLSGA